MESDAFRCCVKEDEVDALHMLLFIGKTGVIADMK